MDNLLTNTGDKFSTEYNKHSAYFNSLKTIEELTTTKHYNDAILFHLIGGLSSFYDTLNDQQKQRLHGIVERALKSGDTYIERKMSRELAQ